MTPLALVTGGSRGIGAAVVAQLRAAGWDVLAPGRAELDFEHEWRFGRYLYRLVDDLTKPYPTHAGLYALVFCHGTWFSDEQQAPEDWLLQYTERVVNPARLMKPLLPLMPMDYSSVVMVSSTQAFGGRWQTGPYAAACAAQVRLMQGYASSYKGIRFNVVCPGLTATAMAAQVQATGDCRADAVPQPPEAVAGAVLHLVTGDENGKVLRVVDSVVSEARWEWA